MQEDNQAFTVTLNGTNVLVPMTQLGLMKAVLANSDLLDTPSE
jgi:hypothetical protein